MTGELFIRMTIADFDQFREQVFGEGYEKGARVYAARSIICGYCGEYEVDGGNLPGAMSDHLAHMIRDHWEELVNVRSVLVTAEKAPTPDSPDVPPGPASDTIPTEHAGRHEAP